MRFAIPLLLVLVVAGCGSDDNDTTASKPKATSTPASSSSSSSAGSVAVTASDFKFDKTTIDAKAGKVKVTLTNAGQAPHEFVVLRTDTADGDLPVKGSRVSEKGSVGEIAETDGGANASHTFDLKAGHYVFVCNVPTHYADGMHGTLTVK